VSLAATEAAPTPERDLAGDPWLPRLFRAVLALPAPPLMVTLGAVLLAVVLDVSWFTASGLWRGIYVNGVPYWLEPSARLNLLYELNLGFSALALIYFVRGVERDLSELEPALAEDPAVLRREVASVPARSLHVGTATGLALVVLDLWYSYTEFREPLGNFPALAQTWFILREVLYDLFMCRVLAWGVTAAYRLSRFGSVAVRIDLLDLSSLRPFTSNGLRLAFFWLLIWSVFTPFLLLEPTMERGVFLAIAALIVSQIGLSAVALTIPTVDVRRRLRKAKTAELRVVREAIARDRAAIIDPRDPSAAAAAVRLPGLLAWEARIAAVPESLLDADSLRRLGLYLLLPLGSWVASALIEHVVEAALR
jgi:hypothetical protein